MRVEDSEKFLALVENGVSCSPKLNVPSRHTLRSVTRLFKGQRPIATMIMLMVVTPALMDAIYQH